MHFWLEIQRQAYLVGQQGIPGPVSHLKGGSGGAAAVDLSIVAGHGDEGGRQRGHCACATRKLGVWEAGEAAVTVFAAAARRQHCSCRYAWQWAAISAGPSVSTTTGDHLTSGAQRFRRVGTSERPAHIRRGVAYVRTHAAQHRCAGIGRYVCSREFCHRQPRSRRLSVPGKLPWQSANGGQELRLLRACAGHAPHLHGPRRTSYSRARTTSGVTSGSRSGSSRPRRASSARPRHPPCQAVSLDPAGASGGWWV